MRRILLITAALGWLGGASDQAAAQRVDVPQDGDLLLGIRVVEPADPNEPPPTESTFTYLVNIGNESVFRTAVPGESIPLTGLGNLGADLTALYGANWHQREDLRWSIVGARNLINPPLYATRPQNPLGTPATPFPPLFQQARVSTLTQILSVVDAYLKLPHTANSTKAAVQPNAANSGSYKHQVGSGGNAFGSLSQWSGIEGGSADGIVNTALDLFRVASASGVETVSQVGFFTIDNTGLITFESPLVDGVRVEQSAYNIADTAGSVTIKIERFGNLSTPVTAVYEITSGSTAEAGVDYTAPGSFDINFAADQAEAEVVIPILNRPAPADPRTLVVRLVSASEGFIVLSPAFTTVTIRDAAPGELAFPGATISAFISQNNVQVNVQRSGGADGEVGVTVSATGGTLVNGTHYTLAPTLVSFPDGVDSAGFSFPLTTAETGTIVLTLTGPTNGATLGAQTTVTVDVTEDLPNSFSWGASQHSGLRSAGLVELEIHRGGGIGATSVVVNTANGTATGADFDPLTNHTVNFAVGEHIKKVQVTLKGTSTRPNDPHRSFTATLSLPGGNDDTISGSATTTVVIVDPDTGAPSVTIATPRANAKIVEASGPSVPVTGTAKDNKGVAKVEVSLNGGPFVEADLTPTGKVTFYDISITAVRGVNRLEVRSVDFLGNASKVVVRNFIYDDPFPGVTGTYTGLATASDAPPPAAPSHATEGLVTVKTTAKGAFSGNIVIDGSKLSFKGTIENDGSALFVVGKNKTPTIDLAPKNKPTRTLALTVDLAKTGNTHKITGTLINKLPAPAGDVTSVIDADRALYTTKKNPVAPLINPPAGLIEKPYTALFDALEPATVGLPANQFPQGDGFARITVSKAGVAKVVGTLADGTKVSASAPVSLAGKVPFYVALYKKAGSISGVYKFEDLAQTDVDGESLYWFRPADAKSKVYPAGWASGVTTDLIGSKFDKAVKNATASIIPGLNHGNSAAANAVLTFTEGRLAAPEVKEVNIAANNKVANVPATDKSYKLAVAGGTGLLTGNFTHPVDGKKVNIGGAVLQKSGRASGFFLSLYNKTGPVTSESGLFTLTPKPE